MEFTRFIDFIPHNLIAPLKDVKKKNHAISPVLDTGRGCIVLPFPSTGFTSSSSNFHTFKLLASLQQSSAILYLWNEDIEGPF